MKRLDKFVIVLAFLVAVLSSVIQRQADDRAPIPERRPPPPVSEPTPPSAHPAPVARSRRPSLDVPRPRDPIYEVEVENPVQSGTGTAFPIHASGVWMTARHVVDGCREVYVFRGSAASRALVSYSHPTADVALLTAFRPTATVAISNGALELGQDGFSFGFPAGQLGAAQGRLMGRSRMQFNGRMSGVTPTLSWAEVRRVPDSLEGLGGISGGPMFDEDGRLIGVHVGGSTRRGRLLSVAPEVLTETRTALPPLDLLSAGETISELRRERGDLSAIATAMGQNFRIAKVYCRAL